MDLACHARFHNAFVRVVAERCHGLDPPQPPRTCRRGFVSGRQAAAATERKARVLEAIGLDDEHTAVYELILRAPSMSVDELAAASGLKPNRMAVIMDELERLGLLARQASAPARVVASPPSIALRPMSLIVSLRMNPRPS